MLMNMTPNPDNILEMLFGKLFYFLTQVIVFHQRNCYLVNMNLTPMAMIRMPKVTFNILADI